MRFFVKCLCLYAKEKEKEEKEKNMTTSATYHEALLVIMGDYLQNDILL